MTMRVVGVIATIISALMVFIYVVGIIYLGATTEYVGHLVWFSILTTAGGVISYKSIWGDWKEL